MRPDTKTVAKNTAKSAVIYCRVSGAKQVREGDGLASQETRCREFAKYKGYEVVEVFADDMTGKATDRPAMKAMLSFLNARRSNKTIVIIDDISRLARGLEAHIQLRTAIGSAGGILESPSIEFGEDSDSTLVENLLASVAQHQREKNGEQTKNRMRARLMNGYWVFQPPPGYKFKKVPGHGKLLVRHEPVASIIQEALEGYATGRFQTQAEVRNFLLACPDFPNDKGGGIHLMRVSKLLNQILYSGYITHKKWNLHLVPAKHAPLISLETFQKIQARREKAAPAPYRKDLNADFPLRGFVTCNDCAAPMTACWSKGKLKHYAYYFCDTKGCESYRKSIPRDKIHDGFEEVVRTLQPRPRLIDIATAMFKDAWTQRTAQANQIVVSLKRDAAKLEKKIDQLLDRIIDADNPRVISAYETRISKLETQKRISEEKLTKNLPPSRSFEDIFELALAFLANPWKLWVSDDLRQRRTLLRLAFTDKLAYCRNQGFRTPKTTLPFNILGGIDMDEMNMVPHR